MNTYIIPRGMKKKKVGGDVYRRRTFYTQNKRGKKPTNHFVGLCVYIYPIIICSAQKSRICASEFKKFVQKWRVVAVPFFIPFDVYSYFFSGRYMYKSNQQFSLVFMQQPTFFLDATAISLSYDFILFSKNLFRAVFDNQVDV